MIVERPAFLFRPDQEPIAKVEERLPDDMSEEVQLRGCAYHYAISNAGPIVLERLLLHKEVAAFAARCPAGYYAIVDARWSFLHPGQYPCMPGWHCDGWPRMQGNRMRAPWAHERREIRHLICVLGKHASTTEFLGDEHTQLVAGLTWEQVSKNVDAQHICRHRPGVIVEMGVGQLHRCPPARRAGTRLFFRISYSKQEPRNILDMRQAVVYAPLDKGW